MAQARVSSEAIGENPRQLQSIAIAPVFVAIVEQPLPVIAAAIALLIARSQRGNGRP